MKNKNWFWGIIFILSAVFVIASQTGSFGHMGILTMAATVLLAAMIISSIVNRNFFGIFLPLAFLYWIYAGPLNLTDISIWKLIIAAVLISMGFSILFRSHPKAWVCEHGKYDRHSTTTENIDDNNPYANVSFGSSIKYLHSDCLKSGQFSSSFGSLEVYFDQVQLDPAGAEIFLDCSFGSIKLYIPKEWRVLENVKTSLGSIENKIRLSNLPENAPKLTLTGNVSFGSIEIQYI